MNKKRIVGAISLGVAVLMASSVYATSNIETERLAVEKKSEITALKNLMAEQNQIVETIDNNAKNQKTDNLLRGSKPTLTSAEVKALDEETKQIGIEINNIMEENGLTDEVLHSNDLDGYLQDKIADYIVIAQEEIDLGGYPQEHIDVRNVQIEALKELSSDITAHNSSYQELSESFEKISAMIDEVNYPTIDKNDI